MVDKKRKHKRNPSNRYFKIHTSISGRIEVLQLNNISKGGAFIKTDEFPELGEIITCTVVNEDSTISAIGWATVMWINDDQSKGDKGFGIEFEKELQEEIVEQLKNK